MKIAIIGGSLGGLLTAFALTELTKHEVTIYERTPHRLADRGAGIRIQPVMVEELADLGLDLAPITATTAKLTYLTPDGDIEYDDEELGQFTSWGSLYRALSERIGNTEQLFGHKVVNVEQSEACATIQFADGETRTADLVLFADGITSCGRTLVDPQAELEYAGYVGWRGFVDAGTLSAGTRRQLTDRTTYVVSRDGHIVYYPMPTPGGGPDLINFVWYRNVPAGVEFDDLMLGRSGRRNPISVNPKEMQEKFVSELRHAAHTDLPPTAAEIVTVAQDPFVQAIYDCSVSAMRNDRVVLIGDSAFVARPHAGAATAKATVNAVRLAETLAQTTTYEEADGPLDEWERSQLEVGRNLDDRTRAMGYAYQVSRDYTPGDPALQNGLYGPGR